MVPIRFDLQFFPLSSKPKGQHIWPDFSGRTNNLISLCDDINIVLFLISKGDFLAIHAPPPPLEIIYYQET